MKLFLMLIPLAMAAAPEPGEVMIVAHKWADSIGFYDPATGASIKVVPAGRKPHEMVITPDRRLLYVTNYGVDVYTDNAPGENTITIIDVARRERIGAIDLGRFRRPHGIQRGRSGLLYVTCDFPPSLVVVDPAARKVVRSISVDQDRPHMVAVTEAEDKGYVSNSGSGTVTAVDLRTGKVLKQIRVDGAPMGMAWGRGGQRLYGATRTGNAVAVIDPARDELLKKIPVPGEPSRLIATADQKYLLASLGGSGEVAVIDLQDEQEKHRFRVGAAPEGLGMDPGGRFAYVSAQADNKVVKISIKDWKPILEISTATRPDPIIVLPGKP